MSFKTRHIIKTDLRLHPSACIWVFFNFLNLCHEIIVQTQHSWRCTTAVHFLVLNHVNERVSTFQPIRCIDLFKLLSLNPLTRMSLATWLFPLPGSPLIMITICPKQTKPEQNKFQFSVHHTYTGSVLLKLLLFHAFKRRLITWNS